MLGLLLIPLAASINMGSAFAKEVTVDQAFGASNITNDKFFVPAEVTVNVGDTVVWTNSDSATHTVTSGIVDDPATWGELFDSGLGAGKGIPGSKFMHTFDEVGEYPYLCQLHPWMEGKVIVVEGMEDEMEDEMEDGKMDGMKEEKVKVTYEDSSFDVSASLSNGSVKFIDIDPDFTSIILTVETSATEDGELMITLPRALIDSKVGAMDDDFIILVEGDEADYMEHHTTDTERVLTIVVPAGTEEIEIVGTNVVPEFPITVMAVMGTIIATAIAVSRFKNPLKP